MTSRWHRSILAVTAVLLGSRAAGADEPAPPPGDQVTVQVTATPEGSDCPDALQLSSAVRREAVGVGGKEKKEQVRLDVAFERSGSGYAATLTASGGAKGTRTLHGEGSSCAALTNALVAASALMVDGALALEPETDAPPPSPVPQSHSPSRPSGLGETPPTLPAQPSWPHIDLDVGGGVAVGIAPSAAPGGYAGAAWNVTPRLAIGLEGWGMPTQAVAFAPGTISIWMAAGSAVVCTTPFATPGLRISACVQPLVGVIHASGSGYLTDQSQTKPWAALAGGLRASGPIVGPVQWSARVEPLVVLDSEGFSVDNLGVGYSPQRVGLFAALGARASFW